MRLEGRRRGASMLALGILTWVVFHVLGTAYQGFALGLGSLSEPAPRYLLFLMYLVLFGSLFVLLITSGVLALRTEQPSWRGWDEREFLIVAAGLGFLIPATLRLTVLGGAAIADDESLYRFSASLLASGRLTAPSHPLKLFFDHVFLMNDGRVYTQYFLGWPAFLALGVRLGMPGFVNALLSALTVPALYSLMRALAPRRWAQVAVLLFLTSPMLQFVAATELSHTSELFALTCAAYLGTRASRGGQPAWVHALFAAAFSVAFFIRPLTALGIGLPFLAWWGVTWFKRDRRPADVLAFLGPAVVLATLFLIVNQVQTGSFLKPAYVGVREYALANGYRFSGLQVGEVSAVPDLALRGVGETVRSLSTAGLRLNFALFGWPSSFLFLPLAWAMRRSGLYWAAIVCFLVLHIPLSEAGIDTFGPLHFTELALPVLVLTALGLRRITLVLARWDQSLGHRDRSLGRIPLTTVLALVLCGLTMYGPYRVRAASQIGSLVNVPHALLRASSVHDAVVFTTVPWALACNPSMAVAPQPWVFWWPLNDPDYSNDIVFANHLDATRDRQLMEHFPTRSGWITHWQEDCTLAITPLDSPEADQVPNGVMITYPGRVVRYDPSHAPTGEVPPGASP